MNSALPADLILHHGDIRTQNTEMPRAEAVAVGRGKILSVGQNHEILASATANTRRVHLNGRLAIPGMIDSHFHYYHWALGRRFLNFAKTSSLKSLLKTLIDASRRLPPGQWICGNGFNETVWPENRLPDRHDLDRVCPDHPVALWRTDLHLAVVNTPALKLAGITPQTPNPPEGIIERDEAGAATGILRELAINPVKNVLPEPTPNEMVSALEKGQSELHKLGLTGIHDIRLMGGMECADALRSWQVLHERQKLNLRAWVSLSGEKLDAAISLGLRSGLGDDRLRIGNVKYFVDGGMGARTAWLLEPYSDGGNGMTLTNMDALKKAVCRAHAAGLAVMIHAIGDRSNRELITIFESLEKTAASVPHPPALPHRIEHVQMIRPEDVTRLARLNRLPMLNLALSVQPPNLPIDIHLIDQCLGKLGQYTYPIRDLLNTGMPMCFSSDCPVCDPSPLLGIHAAVTRQKPDGMPSKGWYPNQRISVDEAVKGYTLKPAVISGAGNELGGITPGKRADITVLDQNIYDIPHEDIPDTTVMMTVFDGEIVYRHDSF